MLKSPFIKRQGKIITVAVYANPAWMGSLSEFYISQVQLTANFS